MGDITTHMWVLATVPKGQELDGYIFNDERHVRAWAAQGFVQKHKHRYVITRIETTRGGAGQIKRPMTRILATLTIDEFMARACQ